MSQATRPNDRHIIWSNQNLDVDDWREDYKEFLEANELDDDPNDEQALYEWMVETNDDYLSDERMNLNVQLSQPIIVIGDIGRWNGRVMGYKDMGTMNTSGVAGLNAAIKWIQDQSISSLYLEEQRKRETLLKLLEKYDFISVIGNEPAQRYIGIVSCVIDGVSSDTAGQLFSERNISVRTGLHCAPLAHRFLGTFPAGTIRFSVNHFTQKEDFSELRAALDDIEENI